MSLAIETHELTRFFNDFCAVSGIDLASGSEPSPDEVEQSMLKGDDGPTPYLNAETARAKRG